MANLSLKHVYKVYPNGKKAVNDFNLDVKDKEFIVLVGPSGCGKSTTLRMIAGLEEITSGELKIGDEVMNDAEPKERDIAMVFQNYALYPHMNVFNNIAFGLKMRKVPKKTITEKVESAARTLGISDYLKKKPKEMSGGQRQRVALGRAIVREPKVMLLDEPLSNLDAKLRAQMRSEIVKLHEKLATTFVYVTHDQVEAMTMGTRIVVMRDGFVMQIDTPMNLYLYPANKFVAGFIGTPQMNFMKCRLEKRGDEVIVHFPELEKDIVMPYRHLTKVRREYLDGKKDVVLGFRSEDASISEDAENAIQIKVSHSEELGTETLVYGDVDLKNEEIKESPTMIIVKVKGFRSYEYGTILNVRINPEKLHLFDEESEESIMPRIPADNTFPAEVHKGTLLMAGEKLALPPALAGLEGRGTVSVPPAAFIEGDLIRKADVLNAEEIGGRWLTTLKIHDAVAYRLSDKPVEGTTCPLGVDFKKLRFTIGGSIKEPLPLLNGIEGTLMLDIVKNPAWKPKKERMAKEAKEPVPPEGAKKKVPKIPRKLFVYSILVGGAKLAIDSSVAQKIVRSLPGRRAFKSKYRFEWGTDDFKIAKAGGLRAYVKTILDYGSEKFLECDVDGNIFHVRIDDTYDHSMEDAERGIRLMPKMEDTRVIEIKRGIRII